MVLEEEEEEEEECEEDFEVEYVEYDGCLWGREWVAARQRYCWWLASADGSPGWPYHMAAAVAHRQRARVTCLDDSGYMFCASSCAFAVFSFSM